MPAIVILFYSRTSTYHNHSVSSFLFDSLSIISLSQSITIAINHYRNQSFSRLKTHLSFTYHNQLLPSNIFTLLPGRLCTSKHTNEHPLLRFNGGNVNVFCFYKTDSTLLILVGSSAYMRLSDYKLPHRAVVVKPTKVDREQYAKIAMVQELKKSLT